MPHAGPLSDNTRPSQMKRSGFRLQPAPKNGPGVEKIGCLSIEHLQFLFGFHMDVSKNRGTPKWMVYNGKPY